MIVGLWDTASGALAQSAQTDLIANNLANASTAGFKRDTMVFRQRLAEAQEDPAQAGAWANPVLDRMGAALFIDRTYTEHSPGPIQQTGKSTDAALDGPGFFRVRNGNEVLFTRAGNFGVNAEGVLVTADGTREVLSDADAPILVGGSAGLFINEIGEILQNGIPVGRLGTTDFVDLTKLDKVGDSLYRARPDAQARPSTARLIGGSMEESNVNPVVEMVQMIAALRAYESNLQMMRNLDGTLDRTVNNVGTVPR